MFLVCFYRSKSILFLFFPILLFSSASTVGILPFPCIYCWNLTWFSFTPHDKSNVLFFASAIDIWPGILRVINRPSEFLFLVLPCFHSSEYDSIPIRYVVYLTVAESTRCRLISWFFIYSHCLPLWLSYILIKISSFAHLIANNHFFEILILGKVFVFFVFSVCFS